MRCNSAIKYHYFPVLYKGDPCVLLSIYWAWTQGIGQRDVAGLGSQPLNHIKGAQFSRVIYKYKHVYVYIYIYLYLYICIFNPVAALSAGYAGLPRRRGPRAGQPAAAPSRPANGHAAGGVFAIFGNSFLLCILHGIWSKGNKQDIRRKGNKKDIRRTIFIYIYIYL